MRRIFMRVIYLLVVMIVAAGLVAQASAQQQVPFKGELQGHDTDTCFNFPIVCVTTNGTGNSTLLGKFSFTLEFIANVVTDTSTGSAHFIAANGDTLDATFVGSAVLIAPNPPVLSITETFTITGGTGRFAGAQGSFTLERLASPVTFMTLGSFDGTITSPGAAD